MRITNNRETRTAIREFLKENLNKYIVNDYDCFKVTKFIVENFSWDYTVKDFILTTDNKDNPIYWNGGGWSVHIRKYNGPKGTWYKQVCETMYEMRKNTAFSDCYDLFTGKRIGKKSIEYKKRVAKQKGWEV